MKKKSPIFHFALIFVFFAGIVLPLLGTLFPIDHSQPINERRTLAALPPLPTNFYSIKSFTNNFESYYNDNFGFRNFLLRNYAYILYHFFSTSPFPARISLGKDGWLFFNKAITMANQNKYTAGQTIKGIQTLSRKIRHDGKKAIVFVAPHKPTIYGDYLNHKDRRLYAAALQKLTQFRTEINRLNIDGYIDMWDVIKSGRDNYKKPIYFPMDSHWNGLGASLAAKTILNNIDTNTWQEQDFKRHSSKIHHADLAGMAGLANKIHVPDIQTASPERIVTVKRYTTDFWAIVNYTTKSQSQKLLEPTLIIHDSYGTELKTILSPYFSSITFVHHSKLFNNFEMVQRHYRESKVIIVEIVERSMYSGFSGEIQERINRL